MPRSSDPITMAQGFGKGNIVNCIIGLFSSRNYSYSARLQIKNGILDMVYFGDGYFKGRPGRSFYGIGRNRRRSLFLDDNTIDPGTFRRPDNGPEIAYVGQLIQQ